MVIYPNMVSGKIFRHPGRSTPRKIKHFRGARVVAGGFREEGAGAAGRGRVRCWLKELAGNREAILSIAGDVTCRVFELYLSGFLHSFNGARIFLFQALLSKSTKGKAKLPWSLVCLRAPDRFRRGGEGSGCK
jgi:hypothetical protein